MQISVDLMAGFGRTSACLASKDFWLGFSYILKLDLNLFSEFAFETP